MKLNPSNIQITNLDGVIIPLNSGKVMGNVLYEINHDLDFLEDAIALNKGEEVEATPQLINAIKQSLTNPICGVPVSVKSAIINHLNTLKS